MNGVGSIISSIDRSYLVRTVTSIGQSAFYFDSLKEVIFTGSWAIPKDKFPASVVSFVSLA
eukprot:gene24411-32858_t